MKTLSAMLKMAAFLMAFVVLGGIINIAFDLDLNVRISGATTSLPKDAVAVTVLGILAIVLAGLGFLTGADSVSRGVKIGGLVGTVLLLAGALVTAIVLDENRYNEFYKAGNQAHGAGEYKQAIALYDKAIRAEPSQSFYYYRRGQAYSQLNNLVGAEADFRKSAELEPTHAIVYWQLAYIAHKRGDKAACKEQLARARSLGYKSGPDICE